MIRQLPVWVAIWLLCCIHPLTAKTSAPPVISCPGDIALQLEPGQCSAVISFNLSATDDETSAPVIVQIDDVGLGSGDEFPVGVFLLRYAAFDEEMNSDTCEFSVVVLEYVPSSPGLFCENLINVAIPPSCEMYLQPASVLEGDYGCYNNFKVDVGNTGSNYIGSALVGDTVVYIVENIETGIWCQGLIYVKDNAGPVIQNCNKATINCLQDSKPVSEGGDVPIPDFSDCTPPVFAYSDAIIAGDCTDHYNSLIVRTWEASDSYGNTSSCEQEITVERVPLPVLELQCPAPYMVECESYSTPDFDPSVAGYPWGDIGGTLFEVANTDLALCNLTASYSDQIQNFCGASYQIIRHWTVIDNCMASNSDGNPWVCTQIIKYRDTTAPVISAPDTIIFSADLPDCLGRPLIPAIDISDCSDFGTTITTPAGVINGNGGQTPAPGLPVGAHAIVVKATDECGNSSTDTIVLILEDHLLPTPVCDEHTIVTLDNSGYGFAPAASFDDGSADNCCLSGFLAARLTDNCSETPDLEFRESVGFCCLDVGQDIQVILRVFDCSGNYNDCIVEVKVQDESTPSIACPPDVTLSCGQNTEDFDLVGEVVSDADLLAANDGFAYANCTNITITYTDIDSLACGTGLISRTWEATDGGGQTTACTQGITIVNSQPISGDDIEWPKDISVIGCSSQTESVYTGEPVLPPPGPCYDLTLTFEDEIIYDDPEACHKILRRWTVADWCIYDPDEGKTSGLLEYEQTILVLDEDAPDFFNCQDRYFCNSSPDCGNFTPDLTIIASDDCSPETQLSYSWTVDLFDNGISDPNSDYAYSGLGQNIGKAYPSGAHRIFYEVEDGCGNIAYCDFAFIIEDCTMPEVFCKNGLTIELPVEGEISVHIMDLEAGTTTDNCTAREDLDFSFTSFSGDTILNFTCADLGQHTVTVWANDESSNGDYCETYVLVQDSDGNCGSPLIAVGGFITTEKEEGLENVAVQLSGSMSDQTFTLEDGKFQFPQLPLGYDYTLTPQFNEGLLNGVTTFDLVLLNRHILNVEMLDSPYKIIAGDVNHSNSLTVSDIVALRKVILGINDYFPNNSSWRFVDANYQFPDPQHPFSQTFPEFHNMNNLTLEHQSVNFKAIKIGDLNGSASVNNTTAIGSRSGEGLLIAALEQQFKVGQKVKVDFNADLKGLVAYQFTLNFDPGQMVFEKLIPGAGNAEENFGLTHIEKGAITTSWHQISSDGLSQAASPQFSLVFTAKEDGELSRFLTVSSGITKAEAYESNGQSRPVRLKFSGADSAGEDYQLFQNTPNPFHNNTIIGFHLPEGTSASLTIFDVSGRLVKEIKGEYSKGTHEIILEKNELPGTGIFYYRLETPAYSATKKLTAF